MGTERFQFGTKTAFPEVCLGPLLRVDSNWVKASGAHPVVAGLDDRRFQHSYYDHWTLKLGTGGKAVLLDDGARPVFAVGEVGKGRVVYDGTILLSAQNGATRPAAPEEGTLIRNAIAWLAPRNQP